MEPIAPLLLKDALSEVNAINEMLNTKTEIDADLTNRIERVVKTILDTQEDPSREHVLLRSLQVLATRLTKRQGKELADTVNKAIDRIVPPDIFPYKQLPKDIYRQIQRDPIDLKKTRIMDHELKGLSDLEMIECTPQRFRVIRRSS